MAYSNGANDNFKGVASLFGSKTCAYKTAPGWAMVTTFCGSISAIFLAESLLKKFSGKGLVPDAFAGSEYFLLSIAIGAGVTVILATLAGFPISTTHVSVGALFGVGLATRQANARVVTNILLSWILTLPCAALIGGLAYWR